MMRIASVAEAQKIDRVAQENYDLSAEILMESAGCLAACEIRSVWTNENQNNRRRNWIAVVCGPGGNGADGLVVARHLASAGLTVRVYLFDLASSNESFKINLSRLPVGVAKRAPADAAELKDASLIVDALLGIGISRTVHGVMKLLIEEMNNAVAPVISLDVPSGLDADSGNCFGLSVKANSTLTFGLAKRGFFVNEGPSYVGRLKILPIGFPVELVREIASTQTAFGAKAARNILPRRKSSSNKTSHGRAVIFAGRPGMIGASLLAGLGAMRSGAGYVTLVMSDEQTETGRSKIANVAPEFQTLELRASDLWEKVKDSTVVIGPGFGVGDKSSKVIHELYSRKMTSVVLDADALTTLADLKENGCDVPLMKSWILTPHAGELSRLLGVQAKDLEANRFGSAEKAAKYLGAIVLFKGFRTVVSDGKRSSVILSGNAALAKAGSGDILSGIIGGFLAQKVAPFEAACLGAYVHGRIADEWLNSGHDILSLQPSDLAQMLPLLLRQIRSSKHSSDAVST